MIKLVLALDFNCNSFTNDCVGFLTGGTIPSFIKGASLDNDISLDFINFLSV